MKSTLCAPFIIFIFILLAGEMHAQSPVVHSVRVAIPERANASVVIQTPAVAGERIAASYDSLAAALSAIGATQTTLVVTNILAPSSPVTVPPNVALRFAAGGALNPAAGVTIIVRGAVEAPPVQVFGGAGTISVWESPMREVYPEWWGVKSNNPSAASANSVAIIRMLDAIASPGRFNFPAHQAVRFGGHEYHFSATLSLKRQVTLQGTGGGHQNTDEKFNREPGTVLVFPSTTHGIVVESLGSARETGRADNSQISDLTIRGATRPPRDGAGRSARGRRSETAHGLYLKTAAWVRNVHVKYFNGDGVNIEGIGAGSSMANVVRLDTVKAWWNAGYGFHTSGNDANAGTFIDFEAKHNGAGGVYENSFLGNTWIGGHVADNNGRGFEVPASALTNRSTFLGCYMEGGQGQFTAPRGVLVVGGTWGDTGTALNLNSDHMYIGGERTPTYAFGTLTPVRIENGRASKRTALFAGYREAGANTIYGFGAAEDYGGIDNEPPWKLKYEAWKSGWYSWQHLNLGARIGLSFSAHGATEGGGQIAFPNGFYLGYDNGTKLTSTNGTTTHAGNLSVTGALSKTAGTFEIAHPLDPANKTLRHGFVEAPRYDLIYRGQAIFSAGATRISISIDEASGMTTGTFEALTKNAQCYVQNESGWSPVRCKVEGGKLTVESKEAEGQRISWLIVAERDDTDIRKPEHHTDHSGSLIPEHEKAKTAAP